MPDGFNTEQVDLIPLMKAQKSTDKQKSVA